MVFVDEAINKTCVGIGGAERYPGKKTFDGIFHMRLLKEEYVGGYKFEFCATGSKTCQDIGLFDAKNGENRKRVILTDKEPYAFELVRG